MNLLKVASALALFSSVTAFACPDLTGSYTCVVDGEERATVISMEKQGNVTVYRMNDGAMVADNKVYKIPDGEGLKKGTIRTWCQNTAALKSELKGKIYDEGRFVGDLSVVMTANLDASTNLVQNVTGKIVAGGRNHPINETLNCTRDIKR